jgi:hypothetical protein
VVHYYAEEGLCRTHYPRTLSGRATRTCIRELSASALTSIGQAIGADDLDARDAPTCIKAPGHPFMRLGAATICDRDHRVAGFPGNQRVDRLLAELTIAGER